MTTLIQDGSVAPDFPIEEPEEEAVEEAEEGAEEEAVEEAGEEDHLRPHEEEIQTTETMARS